MSRLHMHACRVAVALLALPGASAARGAVLYVDASAAPGGNGSSWGSAYRFLQDALLDPAVAPGDEIRVAQGAYRPDQDAAHPGGTQNREARFELLDGLSIYGGFPAGGGNGSFAARDPDAYPTLLDGDIFEVEGDSWPSCVEPGPASGNCFEVTEGEPGCNDGACCRTVCEYLPLCCILEWDAQCTVVAQELCRRTYHLLYAYGVTGALVDGFTICNSLANGLSFWDQSGGGLLARYANPTLIRCTLTRNLAVQGGAVFAYGSSGDPRLVNCVLRDNDAGEGGAIYGAYGHPVAVNCLLTGNSATSGRGGAFFAFQSYGGVYSSTLAGNSASQGGGATFGVPTMVNCIAWDNSPDQVVGASMVAFSCVQGGHAGTGNTGADPAFVDASGGDFRLDLGSPCLDHGNNAFLFTDVADLDGDLVYYEPTPLDLDLRLRIAHTIVDMGAYETCASTADLNGDGSVSTMDLLLMLAVWGPAPGAAADLNGDGSVNVPDLLVLLGAWGTCTPP